MEETMLTLPLMLPAITKTCLLVDAGGLTLHMTICNILDGIIDVVASQGYPFGQYLVDHEINRINEAHGVEQPRVV